MRQYVAKRTWTSRPPLCAVPATAPECGWYNSSTDAGRYCKVCKSTVWWPCKGCVYTPTVPQCAPCALPLAICPKLGCW